MPKKYAVTRDTMRKEIDDFHKSIEREPLSRVRLSRFLNKLVDYCTPLAPDELSLSKSFEHEPPCIMDDEQDEIEQDELEMIRERELLEDDEED